mmetsp:Transcript_108930/g.351566  ORF Transcript_108930/g.351566 Transcript_108930/m.351566 type:complete len:113 (-) Transcript_108930:52-390(-)
MSLAWLPMSMTAKTPTSCKTKLSELLERFVDPSSLDDLIHCFIVASTFDGKLIKVQVIADAQVRPAVLAIGQALVARGVEVKFCPPPKASAEQAVALPYRQSVARRRQMIGR